MIKFLKRFRSPDNADMRYSEDQPYIVYKLSEDGEGYELYEPYDEANVVADSYADGDYVAIPLSSTGCQQVTFRKDEIIKNVKGSSGDDWQGHRANWIQLLRYYGCTVNGCCTNGHIYTLPLGIDIANVCNPTARRDLVGGHVVKGQNTDPAVLPNGEVYLLSICSTHNAKHGEGGTGLGYYMKVRETCTGLRLYGYLRAAQVEAAIQAEAAAEAAATSD